MPRRTGVALTSALAGVCLLLAGCSGSGVNAETLDPPTTTAGSAPLSAALSRSAATSPPAASSGAETSTPRSSSAPGAATGSSTSGGASTVEAAARTAVKLQWIKSWDVYMEIARTPAAARKALVETVAVDPARANMLKDAEKFDSQGLETYGELGHRISWPQPIAGRDYAVIDDCQDASHSGSQKTGTGVKVTVGVARDHYQGRLVKGDDAVWRVEQVFYLKDEPC